MGTELGEGSTFQVAVGEGEHVQRAGGRKACWVFEGMTSEGKRQPEMAAGASPGSAYQSAEHGGLSPAGSGEPWTGWHRRCLIVHLDVGDNVGNYASV